MAGIKCFPTVLALLGLCLLASVSQCSSKSKSEPQTTTPIAIDKRHDGMLFVSMPSHGPHYAPYHPPPMFAAASHYKPIYQHQYGPPPPIQATVEVIDEVTPFANFVRKYLARPKRLNYLPSKKVVIYHMPPPNRQPKTYRKVKYPPKKKVTYKSPSKSKAITFVNDPYDSFYYSPTTAHQHPAKQPSITPEQVNSAILEAFSPAWAESSREPSMVYLGKSNQTTSSSSFPDNMENELDADESRKFEWVQPATEHNQPLLNNSTLPTVAPTKAPSLFFQSVDDYANPIYQELPLFTQDSRVEAAAPVQLTTGNGTTSPVLYVPTESKTTALAKQLVGPKEKALPVKPKKGGKKQAQLFAAMNLYKPKLIPRPAVKSILAISSTTQKPVKSGLASEQQFGERLPQWHKSPMSVTNTAHDLDAISSSNIPTKLRPPSNPQQIVLQMARNRTQTRYFAPPNLLQTVDPIKPKSDVLNKHFTVGAVLNVESAPDENDKWTRVAPKRPEIIFPKRGIVIDDQVGYRYTDDPDTFLLGKAPKSTRNADHLDNSFEYKLMKNRIEYGGWKQITPTGSLPDVGVPKILDPSTNEWIEGTPQPDGISYGFTMNHSDYSIRQFGPKHHHRNFGQKKKAQRKDSPQEEKEKLRQVYKSLNEKVDATPKSAKSRGRSNRQKTLKVNKKQFADQNNLQPAAPRTATYGFKIRNRIQHNTEPVAQSSNTLTAKTHSTDKPSCLERSAGYYADINSGCKSYFYCNNFGGIQKFNCNTGTLYSQAKKVCDWPSNVQCL